MPNGNMIEASDLVVNFKMRRNTLRELATQKSKVVHAVDHIDLSIGRGEIVALVGESGSGKTTTGRALLQLIPPTAGTILFDGSAIRPKDHKYMQGFRSQAQMVFQDPYQSLNPRFNVFDIVTEPLTLTHRGLPLAEKEQMALTALTFAGLRPAEEYLYRYPHELSGGQRQRVSIATCFIMSPDFIVADEPVSMLDASVRADILRLFVEMKQQRGTSFLFITHDLALAWLIADRIAIMYLGKIMEIGPADLIAGQCRHPYAQALVSILSMVGEKQRGRRIVLKGETPSPVNLPTGCRFHPRCHCAQERCTREAPVFREVEPGHSIYCHFPQAPMLERP